MKKSNALPQRRRDTEKTKLKNEGGEEGEARTSLKTLNLSVAYIVLSSHIIYLVVVPSLYLCVSAVRCRNYFTASEAERAEARAILQPLWYG